MPSDIYVISDLHMGDRGPRDNFSVGDREKQFLGFLDHVGKKGGELVILGDVFEFWQANLSTVITRRKALLDRLAELKAIYVLGNHDVDLKDFAGTTFLQHPFFAAMQGPFKRKIGGKTFKFMHGHEADPFNKSDAPSSGRILTILAGMVEDWKGSPMLSADKTVEESLERAGELVLQLTNLMFHSMKGKLGLENPPDATKGLTPTQSKSRLDEHLASIREDRRREKYDVAVVGHTHIPGQVGDWYFNSGSWTRLTNDFLKIGLDGTVNYFQWRDEEQGLSMPIGYK